MAKTHVGASVPLPAVYEPEELLRLYRELPLSPMTVRSVHRYFEAASHLYGIIPLKHLLEIYNRQNPPISQEDFLAVAGIICHEANDFCILDPADLYEAAPETPSSERVVVSLLLLSFGLETYYELSELQMGKPYPILPKERFFAYLDPGFCPATPQNMRMLAFLKKHLPRRPPEELLRTIQTMIWAGCHLPDVIQGLSAMGCRFRTGFERRKFKILFRSMAHHTRKAANRGQSPAAMARQRRLPHRIRLFS